MFLYVFICRLYFFGKTYLVVIMSTHNICFHGEIRKEYQYLLVEKCALSGSMLLNMIVTTPQPLYFFKHYCWDP